MAQRAERRSGTRGWTRADLQRLPNDGNRYEVLDGALLVTPQAAFAHQEVATRILMALRAYCAAHAIGVVVGPGSVPHGKSELQPDVQVIPGTPSLTAKWASLPRPLLVVEVLSESTSGRDLGIKRDAYLRWGIPEYWAVDIDARRVWVSRANAAAATAVDDMLRWQPAGALPGLELRLDELFR